MYVFDNDIGEFVAYIKMAEIPKAVYTAVVQPLRYLFYSRFRNADYRCNYLSFTAKTFDSLRVVNRNSPYYSAYAAGVFIENADQVDTAIFGYDLICDSRADITCADKYGGVQTFYTEYILYFITKLCDRVAYTLMTESAEAVEVLAHL